jgi:hypothetical protein
MLTENERLPLAKVKEIIFTAQMAGYPNKKIPEILSPLYSYAEQSEAIIEQMKAELQGYKDGQPVRCGECDKYAIGPFGYRGCFVHFNGKTECIPSEPTHFCSYGKRKEATDNA